MLRRAEGRAGDARFAMLETLREYAGERLQAGGEAEALRRRHAAYFVALAERAEPELGGAQQSVWLDRLEAEHDNLRAALRWALERREAVTALRLTAALAPFWGTRGYFGEGRRWLTAALAAGGQAPAAARAKALRGAGDLAWLQGDGGAAAALYDEELAVARRLGDTAATARALLNAGIVARSRGDFRQATGHFEESLRLSRALADPRGVAGATANLGVVAELQGDHQEATRRYTDALGLARQLGDTRWVAGLLANLGVLQRDHARAGRLFEESLTLARAVADKRGIAAVLKAWASAARQAGDLARAAALYGEQLTLSHELGQNQNVAAGLEGMARVAGARSQEERAARLFGAAHALRRATGVPPSPQDEAARERAVAAVRARLGALAFEVAWAEGEALAPARAIALALADDPGDRPAVASPAGQDEPFPDGRLTRRERQVAVLVAQHLSNRQIAERLVISERTAENHVQRILDKLGLRSRQQLAG